MPSDKTESGPSLSAEEALRLTEFVDVAFQAGSLEEFAASPLPAVAEMMQSPWALLYVAHSRLPAPGGVRTRAAMHKAVRATFWSG